MCKVKLIYVSITSKGSPWFVLMKPEEENGFGEAIHFSPNPETEFTEAEIPIKEVL